ncbi:urea ABC transporter permease subunit UrtB [Cellvibrio fibrivorans]|uniref:Urea transport system permease protein n=2 Tax=Cellvibrio TaxID=10 RepID=A0ABU1V2T5_9GAMM|nr:urea ABC transporter permease subunit UrtB [Cellvibrio fibrivorans]MDR7091771.1 urea transport system permease protein [Cellvibrio fibrivorans]
MRNPMQLFGRWQVQLILLLSLCCPVSIFAQDADTTASTTEAASDTTPAETPAVTEPEFDTLVKALTQGSLPKRAQTAKKLGKLEDHRVAGIIAALQQGNLYAEKSSDPIVAIVDNSGNYVDAISGEKIAADAAESLKRVPINNTMRTQLRTVLAALNLNDKNAAVRLDAVNRMIADGVDDDIIALLQERQKTEPDDDVRTAITAAVALMNLQSSEQQVRLDAIQILRGSLQQEVRTALLEIATNDADVKVKQQAQFALDSIEDRIAAFRLTENIFFGLSLGSVLLLSAIGLAITFGVMGVINMAHGELMMIGAYVTWVVQQVFPNHIAYSLMIAIPAAFIVAGLVGIAIERGVIRFLYGRPLETLLATFGISLILQQAARSIFSPLNRAVELPEWMSGSLVINPVLSITYNRLYIFIFGLLVFFALLVILKKTSLGLKVRAVSQNRAMARAVGVRASWVDAMTFGLGSGIAGIAGVALSQLTNVGPNLGQAYIIDSFMVVVFGGVGNLWGTLVGAMGLGIINKFLEPYAGAVLAKVLVLVLLILFIQKRPKGIFPQKGRAAAD